jgi:glycosyltransferase involved in cell wall biosynthesis
MTRLALVGFEGWNRNSCIYNIGNEAFKSKILNRLICPYNRTSFIFSGSFLVGEPPYLRALSFLFSKINNIVEDFPSRYYEEQLIFDIFAQRYISGDIDLVIHTDSGLVRTLEKARSMGIRTVILHRTLHPLHVANILREESEKFGIKEKSVLIHKRYVLNRVKTLKYADKIFALSRLEVNSLVKYGVPRSKIELIYHGQGVDTSHFKPSSKKEERFTALFLGHKSLIKGVPYLLEAWRRLKLRDARLIVAGYQDRKLIEIYRKKIQFEAPGIVDPLKYYQRAHVYILPSLGDSFARTVLEAMSCGLPVIISHMVGAKDIIEEGKEGFIIPARSVSTIMDKIQYFYDNPSEIKRMGMNARRKAEQFTWDKFAQEVLVKSLST